MLYHGFVMFFDLKIRKMTKFAQKMLWEKSAGGKSWCHIFLRFKIDFFSRKTLMELLAGRSKACHIISVF